MIYNHDICQSGEFVLPTYDEISSKWVKHELADISGSQQIEAPCLAFTWELGEYTPFFISCDNDATFRGLVVRCYENQAYYNISISDTTFILDETTEEAFEDSVNGICKVMSAFYSPK